MKKNEVEHLNIPSAQKAFLNKLIEKAEEDQKAMFAIKVIIKTIEDIEDLLPGKGQEILKGAHVIIQDTSIHSEIINNTNVRKRISSHYKGTKVSENGVNLPTNSDFLVGLASDGTKEKLWMQLENTKVDFTDGLINGAILFVLHMLDYLYYRSTGKNVGPCGLSEFTESNPITIDNFDHIKEFYKFKPINKNSSEPWTEKHKKALKSTVLLL